MRLQQQPILPLLILSVALLTLSGCGGGKEFSDADFIGGRETHCNPLR